MVEKIGKNLWVVGRTHVGRVRALNEDHFLIDSGTGSLLLADGMGGHDAGEVASKGVVASILRSLRQFLDSPTEEMKEDASNNVPLEDPDVTVVDTFLDDTDVTTVNLEDPTLEDQPNPVLDIVLESVATANQVLNVMNQERGYPEDTGMGTTVVGLWAPNFVEDPIVFHVGDSRLYLLQKGRLNQITRDHSLYQQWVSFGRRGPSPTRNVLLQAMGPSRHVIPDVRFVRISRGDVVLICSDGLTGMVEDTQIQQVLNSVSHRNLEETSDRLITMALEGGGKDNVTLILGYFL